MNTKKLAAPVPLVMILPIAACGAKNEPPVATDLPGEKKESVLIYGSGDDDSIKPIKRR